MSEPNYSAMLKRLLSIAEILLKAKHDQDRNQPDKPNPKKGDTANG